jgi:hypothetical protein
VALYRRTADLACMAFDEPMWADAPPRLVATILGHRPRSSPRSRLSGLLPLLHWQVAWRPLVFACLTAVAGAVVGFHLNDRSVPLDQVALGPVAAGSSLEHELERLHRGRASSAEPRTALVATLKDRNGHLCHELDIRPERSGVTTIPVAVLVSCRSHAGQWVVVGAVRPRGIDPASVEPYVATEDDAHAAVSSILTMIGASQRASALKPESMQQ